MTCENLPAKAKNGYCIKDCICDAVNRMKETYFECDFDIGEKLHSGDADDPEISMYKNGNIKIRLIDVFLIAGVMGAVMTAMRLIKLIKK